MCDIFFSNDLHEQSITIDNSKQLVEYFNKYYKLIPEDPAFSTGV